MNQYGQDRAGAAVTRERAVRAVVPQQYTPGAPGGGILDPESVTKAIILYGVKKVPFAGNEIGLIAGLLLDELFPQRQPKTDVWEDIKGRVEALLKEKLNQGIWNRCKADLRGVFNTFNDYENAAKKITFFSSDKEKAEVRTRWGHAHSAVISAYPRFQEDEAEALLLPMFVQVADLYISLLRDMAIHGRFLGWDETVVNERKERLAEILTYSNAYNKDRFPSYVHQIYYSEYAKRAKEAVDGKGHADHDKQWQVVEYDRETETNCVQVALELWPYMNLKKYPNGANAAFWRQVFIGPYGTPADINKLPPKKRSPHFLSEVAIWSHDRVDALQCKNGETWGPKNGTGGGTRRTIVLNSGEDIHAWKVRWDPFRPRGLPPNWKEYGVFQLGLSKKQSDHDFVMHGTDNRYTREAVHEVIPGYRVTSLTVTGANPAGKAAACLYVGMIAHKFKDIKRNSTYTIVGDHDRRRLDLASYSARDGVPAILADPDLTSSQQWRLVSVGDIGPGVFAEGERFRIVNACTGACLSRDAEGRVFQSGDSSSAETLWELEQHGPATWRLRACDGGVLSVTGRRLEVSASDDDGEAWWLWEVPRRAASASRGTGAETSLEWESTGHDGEGFTARLTLTAPRGSATADAWELSFHLPSEVDRVELAEADGVLLDTEADDKGVRVRLAPSSATPARLDPGAEVTCTLTGRTRPGAPERIRPIGVLLDGTRVID
ncbi:insecticidal delta-endotoxin Cry8Ea1 family protein [Marinactinospora thermotolerans]|uniref:insecticidal delta-endotoxin Cry8Ea1 family protein n=1 Tax=Marinactinospora thermotolerans TaxID=531310 RepID=UPI003D94752A